MSAMTRFTIAVFLHLVGMVGLFFGYGLEWVTSSLLRRSTNAEEVRAWLRIYRLSLPISGPGLLLLILSGGYFASITESMKQGWLVASLLAIVFALGIGFVFILPRVRMLRSEEHTSELQSRFDLVCRLLLEKKKNRYNNITHC